MADATQAETEALLPCPFCQGRAEPDHARINVNSWHWVKCRGAKCEVRPSTPQYPTLAQAIAAWNTRAALTPKPLSVAPEDEEVRR